MTRRVTEQVGLPALTWGLCVVTLNRPDALEECVRRALIQTVPPTEIVIVDASDRWEAHAARVRELFSAAATVPALIYLQARKRSSAVQRNQALEAAAADILFFLDDDSWMAADCAARILETYAADPDGRIVAVAATDASRASVYGDDDGGKAEAQLRQSPGVGERMARLRRNAVMRWVSREVLLFTTREASFRTIRNARPMKCRNRRARSEWG